ncbi:MAG: hypothetical protein KDD22_03185, partial [Bdellovibrionales bacterium]|nr:hypothetical protein [Bdellovibrionales bacterium]
MARLFLVHFGILILALLFSNGSIATEASCRKIVESKPLPAEVIERQVEGKDLAKDSRYYDYLGRGIPDSRIAKQFSPPSPEPVKTIKSFKELTELVQRKQVKSVDELLQAIKAETPDFFGGFTLIWRSQALGRHLISPERPRVLMYGTEGQFMLTFHSHPEGRAAKKGDKGETIETIEYKNGRAYLREFTFNNESVPDLSPKKIETNPQRCLNCHGQDPVGLWEPYNSWPGTYFSMSRGDIDFIRFKEHGGKTLEYRNFMKFLKESKRNPRYQ